jgi:pyridoxine 4-dehydrogenase
MPDVTNPEAVAAPTFTAAPGGTTTLGRSTVARIGYGAMQLERAAQGSSAERSGAIDLLRTAISSGVTVIDTAAFYGDAVCNRLIRDALSPYPNDLVIVSKVGARYSSGPRRLAAAQRPEELRAEVEANLTSLGVERVDIVNLRRADRGPGLVAEGSQVVDLDGQLAEMISLRDEGKIGGIGLSHVSGEQVLSALSADILCVQNNYNVLDRADESVLDLCRSHDIVWMPFFPLGSAFPGRPKVSEHAELIRLAGDLGITPAQLGLAWLLAHYQHTVLIAGTSSASHLAENLAAGDVRLNAETLAELDGLSSGATAAE